MVHEAFYVARTGRPGPVVIDLPKDMLIGNGTVSPSPRTSATPATARRPSPTRRRSPQAVALLKQAKRPVIYAGGGVINSGPRACGGSAPSWSQLTGFPGAPTR